MPANFSPLHPTIGPATVIDGSPAQTTSQIFLTVQSPSQRSISSQSNVAIQRPQSIATQQQYQSSALHQQQSQLFVHQQLLSVPASAMQNDAVNGQDVNIRHGIVGGRLDSEPVLGGSGMVGGTTEIAPLSAQSEMKFHPKASSSMETMTTVDLPKGKFLKVISLPPLLLLFPLPPTTLSASTCEQASPATH